MIPEWYATTAIGMAFVTQALVIGFHWRLAEMFGWVRPLVISAIAMTTVMLPRVVTMLYTDKVIFTDLETVNNLNSTLYLGNSIMFLSAIWLFSNMVIRGRNILFDRILDVDMLRKLKEDLLKMQVGFVDYWQMAESLPEGIILIDEHDRILYVNSRLCDRLGYTKTQLVSQPLTYIMPERYHERHLVAFNRYVKTGLKRISWHGQMFCCCKADGTEIEAEVSYAEFMTDGHRRFVGIIRFS